MSNLKFLKCEDFLVGFLLKSKLLHSLTNMKNFTFLSMTNLEENFITIFISLCAIKFNDLDTNRTYPIPAFNGACT